MLTGLPVTLGLGIVLALVAATLVGARVTARRAAQPVEVRVTGEVPPIPDWLPRALDEFAAQTPGSATRFGDEMDGAILHGHRAQVSLPSVATEFQLRMQPHLVPGTRSRSHPLTIIVDMVESPRRAGFSRLVFGSTPSAVALDLRSRLQDTIARSARNRGLTVQAPRPSRGGAVLAAGLVLIAVALVATVIIPLVRLAAEATAEDSPAPWYPAGATACAARTMTPGMPPTSTAVMQTAVVKGTSCAFAETVRAAYAKAEINGTTVKLGKLRYDKKTRLAVTCTVGSPAVVCKAGSKVVYLR